MLWITGFQTYIQAGQSFNFTFVNIWPAQKNTFVQILVQLSLISSTFGAYSNFWAPFY